jgi:hypothetical protein
MINRTTFLFTCLNYLCYFLDCFASLAMTEHDELFPATQTRSRNDRNKRIPAL